jgi:hypothetical protein
MKTPFRPAYFLFRAATFCLIFVLTVLTACNNPLPEVYPAQEGFNMAGSDKKAIEVADRMMTKMGGFEAWQEARYIGWSFFGQYQIWDKQENLFRHEKGNIVSILNLSKPEGQVFVNGRRVLDDNEIFGKLSQAHMHWAANSYFLCLPYKLKDKGVTLKYKGEGKTMEGRVADILRLTFDSVGTTPNNMSDLYIDKETSMPVQWAFYGNREDAQPSFVRKWGDWKDYHGVMLASNRDSKDDKLSITDIVVTKKVPKELFLSAVPVDKSKIK